MYFADKPETTFDPDTYFDPKAVERRELHDLPTYDQRDLPLDPTYVQAVTDIAEEIRYELRWFNAMTIAASPEQIWKIGQLPFVKRTEAFSSTDEMMPVGWESTVKEDKKKEKLDTLYTLQRKQMNLDRFAEAGVTGKGVRVAIFDAGFRDVDEHPAFAHIRKRNGIVKVKDFYGGKDHVYYHSSHGTAVLSCVGGKYHDKLLGAATDAEFLLARTENNFFEKINEEDHWLAAMEWADKNGADIINSSLGYTKKRYTYEDMDGRTTRVTKAAGIAVSKGILVVNSAGNDGNGKFRFVGAPADGDSVLSVGGTIPMRKSHILFSSFGPNARGIMKPNVCAPGAVVAATPGGKYAVEYGTSFSAPLVAGYAAALKGSDPNLTNMELFGLIERSGHLYPYFDYAHGYGVPDVRRLTASQFPSQNGDTTFYVRHWGDSLAIFFDREVMLDDTASNKTGKAFYYHFEDGNGKLLDYNFMILPRKAKGYFVNMSEGVKGIFRCWFEGYLYEEKVE